jgi:hypothetical protein
MGKGKGLKGINTFPGSEQERMTSLTVVHIHTHTHIFTRKVFFQSYSVDPLFNSKTQMDEIIGIQREIDYISKEETTKKLLLDNR